MKKHKDRFASPEVLTQHISAAATTAAAFDALGVSISFLSVFTDAEKVNLGLSGAAFVFLHTAELHLT